MLISNAMRVLGKFGTPVVRNNPPGEFGRIQGYRGLITCKVTAGHEIRISTISETETDCNGIRSQSLDKSSPISRKHKTLRQAIIWCLDRQHTPVWIQSICGRRISVFVRVSHDKKFNPVVMFNSTKIAGPLGGDNYKRSCFTSNHPEAVAIGLGVLEGNYDQGALGDYLLENCPEFEAVWDAAGEEKKRMEGLAERERVWYETENSNL